MEQEIPLTQPVPVARGLTDKEVAQAQVRRINEHYDELWYQIKDFHAQRRWKVLGYRSFKTCVQAEFHMNWRYAYRLIDAAEIREELLAAPPSADAPKNVEKITEAQARVLKSMAPSERQKAVKDVDFATLSPAEFKRRQIEQTYQAKVARFTAPEPTQALALLDTPIIRVETHRRLEAPQPTVVRYGRPVVTLDTTLGELDALLADRQRFDADLDDDTRSRLATYFARE